MESKRGRREEEEEEEEEKKRKRRSSQKGMETTLSMDLVWMLAFGMEL